MLPKWKVALFCLLPSIAFFGVLEGAAQLVWLYLEHRAFAAVEANATAKLRTDAINYMKEIDPVLGFRLKRNMTGPVGYSTSQGFYQREPVSLARVPGSLRIMAIGESTTQGNGDAKNYPAYLRQELLKSATGYPGGTEVINAGVSGWVSDQWMLWSVHELADYKPDIVIFYPGWNDFQSYDPNRPPPSQSYFDQAYGNVGPWIEANRLKSIVLLAAVLDHFFPPDPSKAVNAQPLPDGADDHTKAMANYRFLFRNLDLTIAAFRKANPKVTIALSTLVGRWPMDPLDDFRTPYGHVWWMADGDQREEAARLLARLNNLIREFARSHDCLLVDNAAYF